MQFLARCASCGTQVAKAVVAALKRAAGAETSAVLNEPDASTGLTPLATALRTALPSKNAGVGVLAALLSDPHFDVNHKGGSGSVNEGETLCLEVCRLAQTDAQAAEIFELMECTGALGRVDLTATDASGEGPVSVLCSRGFSGALMVLFEWRRNDVIGCAIEVRMPESSTSASGAEIESTVGDQEKTPKEQEQQQEPQSLLESLEVSNCRLFSSLSLAQTGKDEGVDGGAALEEITVQLAANARVLQPLLTAIVRTRMLPASAHIHECFAQGVLFSEWTPPQVTEMVEAEAPAECPSE